MSGDDAKSTSRTDRRAILKSFAAGAGGSAIFFGAANVAASSEDDDVQPADCIERYTETRCVESGCDCSECGCECETIEQSRTCCRDSSGTLNCGFWSDTGECCSSC